MLIVTTAKRMRKLSIQFLVSFVIATCFGVGQVNAQVGSWTPLHNVAPDPNNGVMILLTDGSVICHTTSGGNMGDGTIWDRLTPDSTGNYVNGTWSTIAAMTQERYSFSSAMLKDGRVYAAGGEYGTDGTQNGWHGEIYNPTTNTWTEVTGSNSTNVMSDGNCKILDNGNVLQALVDVPMPVHTVVCNPTTNAYTAGPSTLHGQNESMWLKLPDNSILFVDEDAQTSERYIPALNQWIADGNVPVALYDPYGYECGPGWMLPNGKAFFIGGTGHTAFYTPSGTNAPGTWTAGPDVPGGYAMPDAPGAMMINGKILFACSPAPTQSNEFASPTKFYEFDYTTNAYTAVSAPSTASTSAISQQYNLLILPNGQVICGMDQDNSSAQYYVYTSVGGPLAAGKPVITGVFPLTCTTYMITGHGFNGISEGSAFGDENENDTNYPLFRFKSGNRIYYARSYNWNSTGVQRGNKADTAYITVPPAMSSGNYYLFAVANGIASDSVLFNSSIASLSSALTPPSICSGANFTYTPTSTTPGATFTWTRPAVTGISNAAITTAQSSNPNETLTNTTSAPVTVTYVYSVSGGGCSNIQNVQVVVNPKPAAAFTAAPTTGCSVPDSVVFTNTTVAGSTYTWSFGDNGTSTATNPVHAYLTAGTYSVKLVAASACGIDSITHANMIAITPPAAPVATSPVNVSCGGTATLTATGTDTLKWFNQPTGGTALGSGTSYTTPVLGANATYYVESYVAAAPSYCPPLTNTFGTGGNYTNNNFRADVFNVNQPCTLVSVLVVSGAAGNRTIQLQDSLGNVLQSAVVNIPSGTSTVTLNFPLTVGTGYQLGCGDGVTTTNLYRNITGAAFPYNDPSGFISITGNNVPDAVHFYFFYDWKLQGIPCISARTPVAVNITNGLTLTPNITEVACNGQTNGSATITPNGGTPNYTYSWSNGQTTATLSGVGQGSYSVTVHDASGCSGTATEAITQPNALNVSVTPTSASCGSSTGGAAASVNGGTTAYSYSWSNNATTATATGLAPNTYTLTVTDAHSCSVTARTVVGNVGSLTLAPTSTNVACNGASTGDAGVTVTGGVGALTYSWTGGASSASLTNVPAGTYDVTVSDVGGCSGTASVSISQPTALNVSVSEVNSGCGSPNGSATAAPNGGTAGYTYSWSNTATTATISGLGAATYTLTVTDTHLCSVTASTIISNSGLLNVSATAGAANCSGGASGSATATINGGTSPFTYSWSNGVTTASITGVVANTYRVTASDNTGCSGTASVVVTTGTALSITTAPTNVNCFNAGNGIATVNVTSGTSPYQYEWNNGSTTATITSLTSGTYYVTVIDANNCQTADSAIIRQPAAITIFVSASQPTCAGLSNGSANVHATGGTPGYNYLWSNGSSSISIGSLPPGSYSITLTDNNLCTASAAFNMSDPVPVTATLATTNDSCNGSSDGVIVINPAGGTAPYTYLWGNGSTAATLTGLSAGTYTVTINDNVNCTGLSSSTITQPNPITASTSSTGASTGQSNGSATVSNVSGGTAPYTVTWSNSQTGATITGLAMGTYTATITDINGCQVTTSVVVGPVGIENISSELTFNIYPNPAKNEVTIAAGNLDMETTLVLEDVLGQTLITKNIGTSTIPTTLSIANYTSGVYFVELIQEGKKAVKKLVINK